MYKVSATAPFDEGTGNYDRLWFWDCRKVGVIDYIPKLHLSMNCTCRLGTGSIIMSFRMKNAVHMKI